jgi:hypothetical protein
MVIRRVRIPSLVKVLGLIYACIGLVAGALLSLASVFAAAGGWSFGHELGATWGPILFGAGAIIALPIVYGIMGTIVGLLVGFVYNTIAGTVGGLEIDLEETP